MTFVLSRRLACEGFGTAALLAIVVGSGIMGERLAAGNAAIALLANSLATGCGLAVLIAVAGRISGAHFNPLVSVFAASRGDVPWRETVVYIACQFVGAVAGVLLAHAMFDVALAQVSSKARPGMGQWISEAVATFGLIVVIGRTRSYGPGVAARAVAGYITAAYWFTASTSFANPAVTLARMLTDTFAGIRPEDALAFVASQLLGAALGAGFVAWLKRGAVRSTSACPR